MDQVLTELTWEQVVFLWGIGNRNFFRTYDDGSEACVDLDQWDDLVMHRDKGGSFAIETDDIFKWDVTIKRDSDCTVLHQYTIDDSYGPPHSEGLLKKCKELGISGELCVSTIATTIEGVYADSDEYFIYVSPDYGRIYLSEE